MRNETIDICKICQESLYAEVEALKAENARLVSALEMQRKLDKELGYRVAEQSKLLHEVFGAAAFASCFYRCDDELVNATWNCCDWSDWVRRVAKVLDIKLPETEKDTENEIR